MAKFKARKLLLTNYYYITISKAKYLGKSDSNLEVSEIHSDLIY